VRLQGAHDALALMCRRRRVQRAVGRRDLLGVGHALLRLLDARRVLLEHADQQARAEVHQTGGERAVRVVGPDRLGLRQAHRPAVEAGGDLHDRDPGLGVAGHHGPLHGRRPAPARQQRRVHVEQAEVRQQRLLEQGAEGAHDDDVGRGGRDPRTRLVAVDALGLEDLDAELPRRVGHGRRGQRTAASRGTIGPRDDEHRPVRGARQALEHGGGERRRAEEDRPHAASRRSRSARMASLR
jgi:hypothetical protein